jgi:hypothetical protein
MALRDFCTAHFCEAPPCTHISLFLNNPEVISAQTRMLSVFTDYQNKCTVDDFDLKSHGIWHVGTLLSRVRVAKLVNMEPAAVCLRPAAG